MRDLTDTICSSEGTGFRTADPFLQGVCDSADYLMNTRERRDPLESGTGSSLAVTWQVP